MIKQEENKNKRKIKILYLGNFSDPKYEGLMTIVNSLKSHLKVDKIYVNDISKANEVDLINIHSSGFYESIKFLRMKGVKIYSLHANIIPLYFMRLLDYIQWVSFVYNKKSDYLPLHYRVIKICANIVSNFTPIFIKRFFLNKINVVVIPNTWLLNKLKLNNGYLIRQGIDIQKFRNTRTKKRRGKLIVSYFGHPDPEKGIFEVISSFSKLQNNFFEKRMFLTEKNPKIENYINKKDESIKVFGFVNNIVNEYNNSDIIVLPYRHSLGGISTPLVLIEAMACEKAIITTNLPHLQEICGDAVVYVKPYSVKDITKAIESLARNSEIRKKLGRGAREKIVKHYNQEKMFHEYEKLYEKVIVSSQQ